MTIVVGLLVAFAGNSLFFELHTSYTNQVFLNGNELEQFTHLQAGYGTVIIDYRNLASGTYQYSLIVDGKMHDIKQIILAK